MNTYHEWVSANANNPNRVHTQSWFDEDTLILVAYDKITNEGVTAKFKLDSCDKCIIGKYNTKD